MKARTNTPGNAILRRQLAALEKQWAAGLYAPHTALELCIESQIPEHEWPAWIRPSLRLNPKQYALSEKEIDLLNGYQNRYEEGDGMALFEAMEECALHGWLMPSWAHSGFLAGLMRYRRGAVKDMGEAFKLPKQSLKRAHWRMLVPLAQGRRMVELSEYILNHVPTKPSMEEMWKPLADAITENFHNVGWPPPPHLSARTLQRIWQANK